MTVMMKMANTNSLGGSNSDLMTTTTTPPPPQYQHHTTTISKGKKPYKSWLKDGVHGGPSSMEVLVSWLSCRSNYKKWKREDYSIDRVTKKELLEEIIDKLRQVGIYHRLSKDVASKISTLQSNYRMARKWNETEGRKLRKSGRHCKRAIYKELLKRYPYWEALHPVFSGRHISYHRNHYSPLSFNMKSSKPTSVKHPVVFNNKKKQIKLPQLAIPSSQQPILSRRPSLEDTSLKNLVLKCQKNEQILMEQSTTRLNKLRQDSMQKINQEKALVNQAKLQTNLYYEQCLSQAGFTDSEIKALLLF